MKLSKCLILVIVITIAALFYVSMQLRQVEISYQIRQKELTVARLLDQNRILRYNTLALKSPANLERVLLAKNIKMQMPDRREVVELAASPRLVEAAALQRGKDLVLNFFALRLRTKTFTLK